MAPLMLRPTVKYAVVGAVLTLQLHDLAVQDDHAEASDDLPQASLHLVEITAIPAAMSAAAT